MLSRRLHERRSLPNYSNSELHFEERKGLKFFCFVFLASTFRHKNIKSTSLETDIDTNSATMSVKFVGNDSCLAKSFGAGTKPSHTFSRRSSFSTKSLFSFH